MKTEKTYYRSEIESPLGKIRLFSDETHLLALYLEKEKAGKLQKILAHAVPKKTAPLLLAEKELKLYFAHQLKEFTVPIRFQGTEFQEAVWKGLSKIKLGQLRTYGEHAGKVASESAVRAVGTAIGSNPLSIIVPCHRVIGQTGKLTGYAGGLEAKEWLLKHEGHPVQDQQVKRKS